MRFCRQKVSRIKGLFDAFYIDVARVFPRLQEREILTVRRKLGARYLWISKEKTTIDQRRRTRHLFLFSIGHTRQQGNAQHPIDKASHRELLLAKYHITVSDRVQKTATFSSYPR